MKKISAILLITLLTLPLFCLPVSAAPSAQDMAGLTPRDLAAEPFLGQSGAAMLTFKIDVTNVPPGMDIGDDIHVKVEYRIGAGAWELCHDYNSQRMLEAYQVEPGVFRLPFAWVLGNEWDGVEPVSVRVYCEYMRGGSMGTGIISGYSNEAVIGAADGNNPPTKAEVTTALPKDPGTGDTNPAEAATAPPKESGTGNTNPAETAAALPGEPGESAPAGESGGSSGISRAAMLSIGIGLMVLLLLGAAIVVIINMKKKK